MAPSTGFGPDVIANVRDAARIDVVAGRHTALRNAGGGRLKGLCVFHDEKTPSMTVNPDTGKFHCFGCQAGGDVFDFVATLNGITFPESVRLLADEFNVDIPDAQPGHDKERTAHNAARALMDRAAASFTRWLGIDHPRAAAARDWLAQRGFTAADAAAWGIGYAPPSDHALTAALTTPTTPAKDVLNLTGPLLRTGRGGGLADRMRDRIVWPLFDSNGRRVGFAGRGNGPLDPGSHKWAGDGGGKYINPAESALYDKSGILFAYDRARRGILAQQQAILVEGYTDVMAMWCAGYDTTVAVCGTAFTPGHAHLLSRLLKAGEREVIWMLDADPAGQKAVWAGFKIMQGHTGIRQTIAEMPPGEDPNSIYAGPGPAALRDIVTARRPVVAVIVDREIAAHSPDPEGVTAAVHAVDTLLADVADPTLRAGHVKRAAAQLGVDPSVFTKAGGGRTGAPTPAIAAQRPPVNPPEPVGVLAPLRAEHVRLLQLLIDNPEVRHTILTDPGVPWLFPEPGRDIIDALTELPDQTIPAWHLLGDLRGTPVAAMAAALSAATPRPAAPARDLRVLQALGVERTAAEVLELIAIADDPAVRAHLTAEWEQLQREVVEAQKVLVATG